jgi:hypothetical protein
MTKIRKVPNFRESNRNGSYRSAINLCLLIQLVTFRVQRAYFLAMHTIGTAPASCC